MENKRKYRLYLLRATVENVRIAQRYRFCMANAEYILIYTDDFIPSNESVQYHIIEEKDLSRLSTKERVWLLESNMAIISEESEKKQDEIMQSFGERLSRLEQELEIESQRMASGSQDGN